MLTALCKMIPNSKAHSQKDLNSIYTLSTPASKGVENIDALLDTGSTKGVENRDTLSKQRTGVEQDASRQRRPRFRASVVMTTTVPTSTQVEHFPKTGMWSRIGTTSSHPMGSRSVTPSAPHNTGAAQRQYGGESS